MKKTLVITLISIFALAILTAAMGDPQDVYTYDTKLGKVTFDHKIHQGIADNCQSCHHTLEQADGTPEQGCGDCHNDKSDVSAKDAYHGNCIDCHKEMKKGPSGCKDCHVK